MSQPTYRGHCFCGDVRFEAAGPVKFVCCCHCESCRRVAGGAYVPWVTFSKESLVITSGKPQEIRSSPHVKRSSCPRCGTALTYEHEARAGEIDVTVTSFDDSSVFSPQAHLWVVQKLPWVKIDDGLPQYQETPG